MTDLRSIFAAGSRKVAVLGPVKIRPRIENRDVFRRLGERLFGIGQLRFHKRLFQFTRVLRGAPSGLEAFETVNLHYLLCNTTGIGLEATLRCTSRQCDIRFKSR